MVFYDVIYPRQKQERYRALRVLERYEFKVRIQARTLLTCSDEIQKESI